MRNKLAIHVAIVGLLVLALLVSGCSGSAGSHSPFATGAVPAEQPSAASSAPASAAPAEPAPKPSPKPAVATISATVVRVVDGDTAIFRLPDGHQERVRFIGVDTPESTTQIEPYGKQAGAYTTRMLPIGKQVHLEEDVEKRDKYGRLLAYVWVTPPTAITDAVIRSQMFNAWLAINGYAQQMTIQPNSKYADYFGRYVAEARNAGRGLWDPAVAEVAPKPAPVPKPSAKPAPAPTAAAYVGNRNTHKFHHADCSSVDQMNPANKVPFSTREAAIAAGYVPCKRCDP